ncbi:MAG: class I SAM-dependent methyltransferase [Limnospira sp.]
MPVLPDMNDIFLEIHTDLVREAPGGDEYTRKAFQMLPPLSKPNILDVGCGPGAHTLELARLTDGTITAIDTHQPYLDRLQAAAEAAGFQDRITGLNQTMSSLPFPRSHFDLIWAEGSIYIIGFETGLTDWKLCLKPDGYLVVSELVWLRENPPSEVAEFWGENYPGMKQLAQVPEMISRCGYQLLDHFTIPETGWTDYYDGVESRINTLSDIYNNDDEAREVLEMERQEIEMYRKYKDWYGYEFFVMKLK